MKIILLLVFMLTACDDRGPKLTKLGMAGYTFCLKNPEEKLYTGDEIYSCDYYLMVYKKRYENTVKK